MVTVHFHKKIEAFWERNKQYCDKNYYAVESLLNVLSAHRQGSAEHKITAAFNIEGNGSDVFGLWCYPSLMVYGSNFDDSVIAELISSIDPKSIDHASVTGHRDLVLKLLENVQKTKKTLSERNVYECIDTLLPAKIISGDMALATIEDIEVISRMSFEFQKEEYGDRLNKTYDEMREGVVMPGLMNQSFLKWTDQGKIHSILQYSISDNNAPSIMHFFTDPASRQLGYGYALLWNATNGLLSKFESCGLVAKRDYVPSNRAFEKVGYKKVYDWIKIIVESDHWSKE
ncbi:hypothetical protein CAP36_12545 [Chitinophagaceae bacterium IBVUCB2]|nr:hypothetical protein CAP36_12545 [Chitinophagaceae bacterium IBVUCB2]